MKRARIGIPAAGLVASVVALAASCGGVKEATHVAPVPLVTASAPPAAASSAGPAAPAIDLRNPRQVKVSSWTDDDAVRALAMDCSWDPGDCLKALEAAAPQNTDGIEFAPENGPAPGEGARPLPAAACKGLLPLACAQVPGQSCVPDECSQSDYTCVPACDKACVGCAGKCVTGCESCKSSCKDEACRLTCAKSCAECRQSCVQALDHCTTAHCSEESEACFKERDDEWTKSVCPKVCPKVQSCVEKCPEIENDYSGERYGNACAAKCMARLGKGCPARFDRICAGDPNASVNFNAYHANRHGGGD
jgi:hypothetical protein